jgi:phage terminase large subunit-like protein
MVEFRQGFRSMAAPTRELEKLIVSRKLPHGGNPVTRRMAANVVVAAIIAIGRAMVAQEEPQPAYSMFFV